ncbi:uncharacterized protein LOC122282191 [Carya illinoinensis]|uniref:uncharacterized protein LOC122282191 n=1 Tax=Carya illinoinensis TaxID=32201 RepID=UPI001C71C0AC|nr:uncharacterized protein LOC122282191 [Carya illinoinensis]
MTDYMEALKEPTTSNGKAPARNLTWSRLDAEGFKVNWDSAINSREGKIGIGVLVRDHQGRVIGALHANNPLKGSPFDAEAYGVLLTAIFCRELGLKSIYLEGDAKQVVDLLKNHKLNWSLGGCLIGDARQLLNEYSLWSVSHVLREANSAAHYLAKDALLCSEDLYDIEVCPSCICTIVTKEMLYTL